MKKLFPVLSAILFTLALCPSARAENPPLNEWFKLDSSDARAQYEGYYSNNYRSYRSRFTNGFAIKVCVYSEDQGSENLSVNFIPATTTPPAYVEVNPGQTVELLYADATQGKRATKLKVHSWVPGNVYRECRFVRR